jgi:hypothetical protein
MTEAPRRTGEPHDRLTRLCGAMTEALDAHPERRGDEKCIVFLQDGLRGGIHLHGYDSDTEAMAELLYHLTKLFEANGKTLMIAPLGGEG